MRNRAYRPIAAALALLFLMGVPTKAGPIVVSDVVQLMTSSQNPPDLRIRSVSQNSISVSSEIRNNTVQSTVQQSNSDSKNFSGVIGNASPNSDSLLGGVSIASTDQQLGLDVIDQGDVEGTICDCGEIPVAGGFPKWPLLFLAVIPFFFIHHCDDCDDIPTPTPTPTPTPAPPGQVPEPASLLLFGSGLAAFGAGLRRRYTKAKLAAQIRATEEV